MHCMLTGQAVKAESGSPVEWRADDLGWQNGGDGQQPGWLGPHDPAGEGSAGVVRMQSPALCRPCSATEPFKPGQRQSTNAGR